MATAKCGSIFSWDSPMWPKGIDHQYCGDCPWFEENSKNNIFDSENEDDNDY